MRQHVESGTPSVTLVSFVRAEGGGAHIMTLSDERVIRVEAIDTSAVAIPAELVAGGAIRWDSGIVRYANIPERFLPYACLHECVCSITQTPGAEEHCCDAAVHVELESVPESIRQDYLRWRLEFFRGMLAYFEPKGYPVLIEQMRRSIAAVESHMPTPGSAGVAVAIGERAAQATRGDA